MVTLGKVLRKDTTCKKKLEIKSKQMVNVSRNQQCVN